MPLRKVYVRWFGLTAGLGGSVVDASVSEKLTGGWCGGKH